MLNGKYGIHHYFDISIILEFRRPTENTEKKFKKQANFVSKIYISI